MVNPIEAPWCKAVSVYLDRRRGGGAIEAPRVGQHLGCRGRWESSEQGGDDRDHEYRLASRLLTDHQATCITSAVASQAGRRRERAGGAQIASARRRLPKAAPGDDLDRDHLGTLELTGNEAQAASASAPTLQPELESAVEFDDAAHRLDLERVFLPIQGREHAHEVAG